VLSVTRDIQPVCRPNRRRNRHVVSRILSRVYDADKTSVTGRLWKANVYPCRRRWAIFHSVSFIPSTSKQTTRSTDRSNLLNRTWTQTLFPHPVHERSSTRNTFGHRSGFPRVGRKRGPRETQSSSSSSGKYALSLYYIIYVIKWFV